MNFQQANFENNAAFPQQQGDFDGAGGFSDNNNNFNTNNNGAVYGGGSDYTYNNRQQGEDLTAQQLRANGGEADYVVGGGSRTTTGRQPQEGKGAEKQEEKDDEDTPIIGKKFKTDPLSRAITRFPLVFFSISSVILLGLSIALLAAGPEIVAALQGFVPENSERYKDAVHLDNTVADWSETVESRVVKDWSRNSATRGKLDGRVTVIFEVDADQAKTHWDSLATAERAAFGYDFNNYSDAISAPTMLHVARVIKDVMDVPDYNYVSCWGTDNTDPYQYCTPPNSLSQYYFPGMNFVGVGDTMRWSFPGYSKDNKYTIQGTIPQVKDAIKNNKRFYWYIDEAYETVLRARLTRVVFAIGTPVVTTDGVTAMPNYFANDLARQLSNAIRKADHPFVKVHIGGWRMFDQEVTEAVQSDIKWVLISCVFVFAATRIHMHSLFLAFFCVIQTLTVFAASMFLFSIFTGQKDMPMLAVILYYVEMLMALLGQMVAFDVFKWSGRLGDKSVVILTVAQRTALVLRHAVAAITMVSVIILAIFVVAVAGSSIPVVRDFSIMMIIMTVINWLTLVFYFPACILTHHFYFSHKRRNMQKQRELKIGSAQRTRIAAQISLHSQMAELYERYSMPSHEALAQSAQANLQEEIKHRKEGVSLKARLNLKPHFRRIGRQKANMLSPSGGAGSGYDSTEGVMDGQPGRARGEDYDDEEDVEMTNDDFDNVDARGFVIQKDALTLPVENVIRIEKMNCENRADPIQVTRISSQIKSVDDCTLDATLAFREACGIRHALSDLPPPSQQQPGAFGPPPPSRAQPRRPSPATVPHLRHKLLEVTRLVIHHVEGYGWAMSIPMPKMAHAADKTLREEGPPPNNCLRRAVRWIDEHFLDRNRKYFFGMCGPHLETQKARVARIKNLSTKKEGPNRMERFLGGPFLRTVVGAPKSFFFVTMLLAFLVVGATVCGFVDVASSVPTFLPRGSGLESFNQLITQFGDTRPTCDYCSPYFVETSTLSRPQILQCESEFGFGSPYNRPNSCGSCSGKLDCYGCDGVTAGSTIDGCNQCLLPSDSRRDKCQRCIALNTGSPNIPSCNPCPTNTGGPLCSNTCRCSPSSGRCNSYTGGCSCFSSFDNGFFSGSTCSQCDYNFKGTQCKTECAADDPCGCNPYNGRCGGCLKGFIGPSCAFQDPAVCMEGRGVLDEDTLQCTCNAGYGGLACRFNSACRGRGTIYAPGLVHQALEGKCVCEGNFFGPSCEFCRCYNGGTCNEYGVCQCKGSWTGSDCSSCNANCPYGGYCPVKWEPSHYDYFTCIGLFCTISELQTGVFTSSFCQACQKRTASMCNTTTQTCDVDIYNTTRPRNTCLCRGRWKGEECATCDRPYPNLFCNREGETIGCDGAVADRNGNWKVVDRCGICGGNGVCTGCDGGFNNKKIDKCGVCGGNNTCPVALRAAETVLVLLEFTGDHPITSAEYSWLKTIGDRIWIESAPIFYNLEKTNHLQEFIKTDSGTYSQLTLTTMASYLSFALNNRVADYIGFGYARPSSASFDNFDTPDRIRWIMYEYRANGYHSRSKTSLLRARYDTFKKTMDSIVESAPSGFVKSYSIKAPPFTALGTRDAVMWDSILIITVASVTTLGLLAVFVCSVKLVVAGACVLATAVVCSVATVRVLGLEYGPVEMIVVLFVLGFIASCVIYMADGYLEELHAVQSHLMAVTTTRRQNIKGMLRRTGVPVTLSCLVVFASSLLLLGAKIDVINNVGKMMSIASFLIALFCMLGFPALLSIFGPHKIRRNKPWMVIVLVMATIVIVIVSIVMHFIRKSLLVD